MAFYRIGLNPLYPGLERPGWGPLLQRELSEIRKALDSLAGFGAGGGSSGGSGAGGHDIYDAGTLETAQPGLNFDFGFDVTQDAPNSRIEIDLDEDIEPTWTGQHQFTVASDQAAIIVTGPSGASNDLVQIRNFAVSNTFDINNNITISHAFAGAGIIGYDMDRTSGTATSPMMRLTNTSATTRPHVYLVTGGVNTGVSIGMVDATPFAARLGIDDDGGGGTFFYLSAYTDTDFATFSSQPWSVNLDAPSNSFKMNAAGESGFGVASPTARVDILPVAANAVGLRVTANASQSQPIAVFHDEADDRRVLVMEDGKLAVESDDVSEDTSHWEWAVSPADGSLTLTHSGALGPGIGIGLGENVVNIGGGFSTDQQFTDTSLTSAQFLGTTVGGEIEDRLIDDLTADGSPDSANDYVATWDADAGTHKKVLLQDVGTQSPLTTKGDLWGYTTTDARVGVGANGTLLQADSGEASGVGWDTTLTGNYTMSASGTALTVTNDVLVSSGTITIGAGATADEFLRIVRNTGSGSNVYAARIIATDNSATNHSVYGVNCQVSKTGGSTGGAAYGGFFRMNHNQDAAFTSSGGLVGGEFQFRATRNTATGGCTLAIPGRFTFEMGSNYTATIVTGVCARAYFNDQAGNVFTTANAFDIVLNGNATFTNLRGLAIPDLTTPNPTNCDAVRVASQTSNGAALKGNVNCVGGDWNTGHLQLGDAHIWASSGVLRFAGEEPGSATDAALHVDVVSGDPRLGFYDITTPVTQPTTGGTGEATFVENAGTGETNVNDNSTFDGYTLRQVVQALRDLGLLA